MKRKPGIFAAVVILFASLYPLVWGFIPSPRETTNLPLLPTEGIPSLPGNWMIHLTYSQNMRAGETQTVELSLVNEDVQIDLDVYNKYRVFAEARLDFPLVDVRPADLLTTVLVDGGKVTFYWEIYPRQTGNFQGTVWVFLRFIPKTGGQEVQHPVSAQLISINSGSLMGWTGTEARMWGVFGLIVGLTAGIPFLVDELSKKHYKKR